ncbi:MAG: hypothetical protein O7J95_07555, partial [Planctomycetota bacterium]|nr:hypothetical protein [Planctomycetota bacterium]
MREPVDVLQVNCGASGGTSPSIQNLAVSSMGPPSSSPETVISIQYQGFPVSMANPGSARAHVPLPGHSGCATGMLQLLSSMTPRS